MTRATAVLRHLAAAAMVSFFSQEAAYSAQSPTACESEMIQAAARYEVPLGVL